MSELYASIIAKYSDSLKRLHMAKVKVAERLIMSSTEDEVKTYAAYKVNPNINLKELIIEGLCVTDVIQSYIPVNSYAENDKANAKKNEVYVSLDDDFSKINYVPGLKTTLYRHQRTVVKALLDMENNRRLTMNDKSQLTHTAIVLSEPVGSGKTIDILALILLSKIPKAIPDVMPLLTHDSKTNAILAYATCKYKRFLTPTIIFVGSSVMKQWSQAIKQFTDLNVFIVTNIIDLRMLLVLISRGDIKNYDIVLVKNGHISRPLNQALPYDIPLQPKNTIDHASIYNIISNLNEVCWARVIIDDFDTIHLPKNASIIKGVSTIYISATRKIASTKNVHNTFRKASEYLLYNETGCFSIQKNKFLFDVLNVRNSEEYIKETTTIPKPKYHAVCLINTNNQLISVLGSIGDSEINQITEMLNSDAIGSAAEKIGIKSTSVADIFGKILGDKSEQYKFSTAVCDFIDYSVEKEPERKSMNDNPNHDDTYNKGHLLEFREIEYKYPNVKNLLTDTKCEYTSIMKSTGMAIQRVKDNIKHGTCPICEIDLVDVKSVIIIKCCNAVFCSDCGIKAQNLGDRANQLANGRCSNCRAKASIKDLIYIGDEIKLNDIVDENMEAGLQKEEAKDIAVVDEIKPSTKISAIMNIIYGVQIKEDKRIDLHVANMIKGQGNMPEPKNRKVLIFANYDETLSAIQKELAEKKIMYWRLQGGAGEIANTANMFTSYVGTCAMVINSTKHCAGLNLQTATDLIFTHRIMDNSIESQVIGRGHRLGRTSPLNVWYLVYDNEYNSLIINNNARELTDSELAEELKNEMPADLTIGDTESKGTTQSVKSGSEQDTQNINILRDEDDEENDEYTNDSDTDEEKSPLREEGPKSPKTVKQAKKPLKKINKAKVVKKTKPTTYFNEITDDVDG